MTRIGLALPCLLLACGESTGPGLTDPGYTLFVSIPGLTDTTFHGDSLYWKIFIGETPDGTPVRRQLTLEILVLDPPAPLESPLQFQLIWPQLQTELPAVQSYQLGLNPPYDVTVQANSNLGTWGASKGQLVLTSVSDTSLSGSMSATMVPIYPPGSPLPAVTVRAVFWAPRRPDAHVPVPEPTHFGRPARLGDLECRVPERRAPGGTGC